MLTESSLRLSYCKPMIKYIHARMYQSPGSSLGDGIVRLWVSDRSVATKSDILDELDDSIDSDIDCGARPRRITCKVHSPFNQDARPFLASDRCQGRLKREIDVVLFCMIR